MGALSTVYETFAGWRDAALDAADKTFGWEAEPEPEPDPFAPPEVVPEAAPTAAPAAKPKAKAPPGFADPKFDVVAPPPPRKGLPPWVVPVGLGLAVVGAGALLLGSRR